MKKTLLVSAVFFIARGTLMAGQLNLESAGLRSLGGELAKTEVAAPAAPKAAMSWAEEVSLSLKKDLGEYRIKAGIRIVKAGGEEALEVNFLSKKDYETIKDLFYQDPGDGPSYMDVKICPLVLGKPVREAGRSIFTRSKLSGGASACFQQALQYVSPPPSAAKLCQGAADTAPVDCYASAYQVPGVGASVAFSICIHAPAGNSSGPLDCFQSLKSSLGDSTAAVLCRGSADAQETLDCYNQMLAENANPGVAAVTCSR
ncbi:MAG: hypothetical protein NTY45_00995 [Elusimicrobia bacterium]|nr:hypothetical protein [Elusimicrobiota bacterium]